MYDEETDLSKTTTDMVADVGNKVLDKMVGDKYKPLNLNRSLANVKKAAEERLKKYNQQLKQQPIKNKTKDLYR